jgi:hypothetical protein
MIKDDTPRFAERLRRAMDGGSLTRADLSRWFDRPYTTIYRWLQDDRDPWGPNGAHAYALLAELEDRIKLKKGFPIPFSLSPALRVKHMEGLKRGRLSSAHFAK